MYVRQVGCIILLLDLKDLERHPWVICNPVKAAVTGTGQGLPATQCWSSLEYLCLILGSITQEFLTPRHVNGMLENDHWR